MRQEPKLPEDPDKIELDKWYRLEPKNRHVKSFYGKANIMFRYGRGHEIVIVLMSYKTIIAVCDRFGTVSKTPVIALGGKPIERKLSQTSSRHFSEFRSQAEDFAEIAMTMTKNRFGPQAMVL